MFLNGTPPVNLGSKKKKRRLVGEKGMQQGGAAKKVLSCVSIWEFPLFRNVSMWNRMCLSRQFDVEKIQIVPLARMEIGVPQLSRLFNTKLRNP
jgi:hypothetical protein